MPPRSSAKLWEPGGTPLSEKSAKCVGWKLRSFKLTAPFMAAAGLFVVAEDMRVSAGSRYVCERREARGRGRGMLEESVRAADDC